MPAFLRKLLGLEDPTEALRAQFGSEGVIDVGANVAVIRRFSGSVPGLHSGSSISRTAGSLVLTPQRVVAVLAVRSDPSARAVDCRWDAADTGPMKIELATDGLTLDVDVHRVDRSFQGHLSLHYKHRISADVLARVPRTSLRQVVSAEFVCRALGVRPPKPEQ
jgi:hypothetical protein